MKGRKHTPEQIIRKLREADRMLGEAKSIAEEVKSGRTNQGALSYPGARVIELMRTADRGRG